MSSVTVELRHTAELRQPARSSNVLVLHFFQIDAVTKHVDPGYCLEPRIPADHPLRAIRELVDAGLAELSRSFDRLYAREGRPSIPPKRPQRALLLQALPKDGSGKSPSGAGGGGRNAERNFHGEKRKNDTHSSTADPDVRLFRKGAGKEAKLCRMGRRDRLHRRARLDGSCDDHTGDRR